MIELVPLFMFAAVFAALILGYPAAATLAGVALAFALGGALFGVFDLGDLGFLPGRLFGIVTNQTLLAVPLFVFMGVMLEKTRIAERLLACLTGLMSGARGGLACAVILVGMLMSASTGIVGATVVTLGLIALPTMLKAGYDSRVATGTIAATGTLGQIIPPSIVLVLLGDVLSNAYSQAQLEQGIFAPQTVSVGDLFAGALIPGLLLVVFYLAFILITAWLRPERLETNVEQMGERPSVKELALGLAPPLVLIVAVLGAILGGYSTPTEAAGVGAFGAVLLALAYGRLSLSTLRETSHETLKTTAMVFFILIGASIFSLVFRAYGGDELVRAVFEDMPGGAIGALIIVMLVLFLLGFILDFIEITFVVVPIVGPVLLAMGFDPVWLGIMIAINLQTSFLTPPFGFSLFYLRGVTPASVTTPSIYRGALPFIGLQILMLGLLVLVPELATWLPYALR
ncbi:MAG: TRAP transporter large permease subunit [Gammaproteobacteria bacterium]|nr:TRAP transporter large permease subunit [Gammaproteobacteria bacterium]